MHLDDPSALGDLIQKTHFTILITEAGLPSGCATDTHLVPIPLGEKHTHDIDTIRAIESLACKKHPHPITILLEDAHLFTYSAQHAFLKTLEEPIGTTSFLFVAPSTKSFLPTTLSRANVLYLNTSTTPTPPSDTVLKQARTLVAGNQRDLIPLATTLAKSRDKALEVTRTAINLLYESQLKSPTSSFLLRLEKLLSLEKALSSNGHIKLHIASMIQ